MNTNRWMQEVNARFPVRKSKVQKAHFRQYVLQKAQEMGYTARMEENKAICTNRNIVVGDVDKAKVLGIPLIIAPKPSTSSPLTKISRKSAIQTHCLHAK